VITCLGCLSTRLLHRVASWHLLRHDALLLLAQSAPAGCTSSSAMADTKSKTCWTAADEATLVDALTAQKRAGNMSENGWKPTAFTAVVVALEGSENISGGAAKTVATVKSRWQRVIWYGFLDVALAHPLSAQGRVY
jgi:hypothetical protein